MIEVLFKVPDLCCFFAVIGPFVFDVMIEAFGYGKLWSDWLQTVDIIRSAKRILD